MSAIASPSAHVGGLLSSLPYIMNMTFVLLIVHSRMTFAL